MDLQTTFVHRGKIIFFFIIEHTAFMLKVF